MSRGGRPIYPLADCGGKSAALRRRDRRGFFLEPGSVLRDNARADRTKIEETGMTLPARTLTAAALISLIAGAAHAAGNAENGQKLFNSAAQCKVCHSIKPDQKMVGPSMFGVVGRKCGTAAKQTFSGNYRAACEKTGFSWDEKSLDGYLADPTAYISKITGETRRSPMSRATPKAEDRADIIAYLKTLK
jgi:cytochrome c